MYYLKIKNNFFVETIYDKKMMEDFISNKDDNIYLLEKEHFIYNNYKYVRISEENIDFEKIRKLDMASNNLDIKLFSGRIRNTDFEYEKEYSFYQTRKDICLFINNELEYKTYEERHLTQLEIEEIKFSIILYINNKIDILNKNYETLINHFVVLKYLDIDLNEEEIKELKKITSKFAVKNMERLKEYINNITYEDKIKAKEFFEYTQNVFEEAKYMQKNKFRDEVLNT